MCAADRMSYRGIPPWDLVTIVPVSGRRLHAKFIVLQYERLEEPLLGIVAKRITRAIVTSANLTQGGLSRNREIWALQDTPSTAGAASSLSRDLLPLALSLLANQATTELRTTAGSTLTALQDRLPAGTVESGRVVQSFSAEPKNGLLAATGLLRSPARRVGIVTPAFATEQSSGVVKFLGRLLDDAVVDLYVSTGHTRQELESGSAVSLSTVLVREIDRRAKELRVWAVPVDEDGDDGNRMSRPLHAKAVLAIEHGTNDLHVLVGSANLTTRGMGGQNRELLVQQAVAGGGDRAFDQAVKSLDAVLINRTRLGPAPPPDDTDLPLIVPARRTLIAYFWPNIGVNAGMSRLTGELCIDGDLSRVTEIRAGDTPLKVTANTQNVSLDADHPALQARVDGVWVDVPITNCAPLDSPFWDASVIDANGSSQPPDILSLLADLRWVISPTHPAQPDDGNPGGCGPAGKFTLPYERRLPALAVAIPRLLSTGAPERKYFDQLLDAYFEGHPEERIVAAALVDVIYNVTYQGPHSLLTALQGHTRMPF